MSFRWVCLWACVVWKLEMRAWLVLNSSLSAWLRFQSLEMVEWSVWARQLSLDPSLISKAWDGRESEACSVPTNSTQLNLNQIRFLKARSTLSRTRWDMARQVFWSLSLHTSLSISARIAYLCFETDHQSSLISSSRAFRPPMWISSSCQSLWSTLGKAQTLLLSLYSSPVTRLSMKSSKEWCSWTASNLPFEGRTHLFNHTRFGSSNSWMQSIFMHVTSIPSQHRSWSPPPNPSC